jgi:hypothetical protein
MYEAGGLPPPEKIVWFDSPMAMCVKFKKTNTRLVQNAVRNAVWSVVQGTISGTVSGAVRNAVRDAVWDVVGDTVSSAVGDAVHGAVGGAVHGAVHGAVWNTVYGSYEAHWLSQYDYYREVLGLVKETDRLTGLFELAKSCGWIIPCKKVCYASERHNVLNRDNQGKLHCVDGPAVRYPDGWSIYSDHEVVVPEKVVTDPEGFTFKELKELKMHEVKVVLRKIGMEKFMSIPGTTSDTWTRLFKEIAEETVSD